MIESEAIVQELREAFEELVIPELRAIRESLDGICSDTRSRRETSLIVVIPEGNLRSFVLPQQPD